MPKPLYAAPVLAMKVGKPLVAVDISEAIALTGDAACWVGASELVKIKAANFIGAYQVRSRRCAHSPPKLFVCNIFTRLSILPAVFAKGNGS